MLDVKKGSKKATAGTDGVESKPVKKKYVVAGSDAYGMHYLGFEGGGELADSLKNCKYTSLALAEDKVRALNEGR